MVSPDNISASETAQLFRSIRTESGANLVELTEASPVLLIFLRHFGCSFCRQTISDVADRRGDHYPRERRLFPITTGYCRIDRHHHLPELFSPGIRSRSNGLRQ